MTLINFSDLIEIITTRKPSPYDFARKNLKKLSVIFETFYYVGATILLASMVIERVFCLVMMTNKSCKEITDGTNHIIGLKDDRIKFIVLFKKFTHYIVTSS